MHEPVTKRRPMIDMEEFERRLRQSSGNQTDIDPLAELARLIGGQQDLVQRVAEPQDDKMACQGSGTVDRQIASRRSLFIMIMAAIIIVGMVGVGASVGYKSGASPAPEIATISENGPAKPQLEKTNRSKVPTPDSSLLDAAPQPSPAANNVAQPVDPSQPQETMPPAGIAPSPEQIEPQLEPSKQTAPIEPEKMSTASVDRQDALISNDMPPRAMTTTVPLPIPRPLAVAKTSTPKTRARVAMPRSGVGAKFQRDPSVGIATTTKPKRPASTVTAQPVQATDSPGGGREPDPLGELLRGLFGNVREP
jgi:hypothetical protein